MLHTTIIHICYWPVLTGSRWLSVHWQPAPIFHSTWRALDGWREGTSAAAALYHRKGMVLAPRMCGCLFEEEYERLIEQTCAWKWLLICYSYTPEILGPLCVCVCVCHGWQLLSSCLVPFLLDIIRALFWTIVLEQIHPSVCYLRWKTKGVLVPGPLQRPPHTAGLTGMWRLSGMLDTEKGRGVR